uniref:Tyrosine-protein kinase BAZ1B n=1 Tax=Romanomermis culicivorax TaxID=13658 RepID=A0A915HKW0_ROMCU
MKISSKTDVSPTSKCKMPQKVVELSSDSDDEPIAKKIKIDEKKVDRLKKEKCIKKSTNMVSKKVPRTKPASAKQVTLPRPGHQSLTSIKGKLSALKSYLIQPPTSSPLSSSKFSSTALPKMPTLLPQQDRTAATWNEAIIKAYQAVQNSKQLGSLLKNKPATSCSMPHLMKNLPSTSKVPLITAKPFSLDHLVIKCVSNRAFRGKYLLKTYLMLEPKKFFGAVRFNPDEQKISRYCPAKITNLLLPQLVMCVGYPDGYFEKGISGCEKIYGYIRIFSLFKKEAPHVKKLGANAVNLFQTKSKDLATCSVVNQQKACSTSVKPCNIVISPINRENIVRSNITRQKLQLIEPFIELSRLEARWNDCIADVQKVRFYRDTATSVVNILTRSELQTIRDQELRKDILARYEAKIDRHRMIGMSDEERSRYLKDKYNLQRQVRRAELAIGNFKLPVPKTQLIPSDCDLLSGDYGDVLMIADFITGYADLLTPKDSFQINADTIIQGLRTAETSGFELAGRLFVVYVETLIQNESPLELGTALDDVPVNIFTSTELVRLLCIPPSSRIDDGSDSGFDASSSFNETLNDQNLEKLSTCDFYTLPPRMLLSIIVFLQDKLLQSPIFDDFLREKEDELTEAWKEKIDSLADLRKFRSEAPKNYKVISNFGSVKKTEVSDASALFKSDSKTDLTAKDNSVALKQEDISTTEDRVSSPATTTDLSDVESMIYKVKNRRAISQKEKEKRVEEERLEKERRMYEAALQSKENRVAAAAKKLAKMQAFFKSTFRCEPIGFDRDHNRYWFLPNSASDRIFVEKIKYPGASSKILESKNGIDPMETEKVEMKIGNETEDKIESEPGATPGEEKIKNAHEKFKEFIASELIACELKIRSGGLGGVEDFDTWKVKVQTAENIADMGHCLIEMRNNIRPSLLKGIMSSKKVKRDQAEISDNQYEHQHYALKTAAEHKVEAHAKSWLSAITSCQTWSRLTVLYYILHSCIMWDKSVENAPCKVCRKRKDDDLTILCDECNECYHIYCLRPPLKRIPQGDWFCTKCRPKRNKELRSHRCDEEDVEKEERHDDVCTNCKAGASDDNPLMECSACPCVFHMDCHRPPLKHEPRSGWKCCVCTKGEIFTCMRSGRSRR